MPGLQIQFEAIDEASPTIQKLSEMMVEAAKNSDRLASEIMSSSQRVDTSLKKIPKAAKESGDSLKALRDAGGQLQTALLGFATVAGIATFFKSSADAALGEEEALRKLEFAVNATGGSFEQSKEAIMDFARQQQALTQFSDTQTFESMGRMVRVTGDVGQAMQATRLAFGLASTSGKDLNTIMDLLGPVLQGDASRLRGLKNEFGAFIGPADTAQEVIDALSKKFIGAAEHQTGFGKEMASLKNRLGDFQETVGAGVLPVFTGFLGWVLKGAQFFEMLGVVIANWAAHAMLNVKDFAEFMKEVFTLNFNGAQDRHKRFAVEYQAVEEASAQQAAEVEKKYSRQRVEMAKEEGRIKVGVTKQTVQEQLKQAEERQKAEEDFHETVTKLEAERLKLKGENTASEIELIDLEREQRFQQLDDLAQKAKLTEQEVLDAKALAFEIARLKSEEAKQKNLQDLKELEEGAKHVGASVASSLGSAFADVIVEGKNFQEAMDAAFKQILKTAIETFTRIAIESAILRGSTGGLGMLGGILAVGAIGGGAFKGFKLQEGGIVRRPTIAEIGEAGPEAVIPLHRLGSLNGGGSPSEINLTINQTNNISVQGVNDDQVKEMMRRISEATRSGAAEGAELVKTIFSRETRFAGRSV